MWILNGPVARLDIAPDERQLRIGLLLLAFVAMNQIKEPLVGATLLQELTYGVTRFVILAAGLVLAERWITAETEDEPGSRHWFWPIVGVTLAASALFALVEIFIEPLFPIRPEFADDEWWAVSPLLAYVSEFLTVASLLLPVHLIIWLLLNRSGVPIRSAGSQRHTCPEFLIKAGVKSTEAVLALEAEEHYVRVHTHGGTMLVAHRFGDAVAAMPKRLGQRVHRSWWVADSAVTTAKRGARRWQLQLADEQWVPVSDSYLQSARNRGLLNPPSRA